MPNLISTAIVPYSNPAAEACHRRRLARFLREWAEKIEGDELEHTPSSLLLVSVHDGGHEHASVNLRGFDGLHTAGLYLIRRSRELRAAQCGPKSQAE